MKMAVVIIKGQVRNGDQWALTGETDLDNPDGTGKINIMATTSKAEWLVYKQENPEGTLDDYLIYKFKPMYELALRAVTGIPNLINKSLTW
jgi:hypothetical protein